MALPLPSYVLGYGCVTAAGQGALPLFNGLVAGVDHSQLADTRAWPRSPSQAARLCKISGPAYPTSGERMASELVVAFEEASAALDPDRRHLLSLGLGVIFASTKGQIEDLVWNTDAGGMEEDTLAPVLRLFLAKTGLRPLRALSISNACSSVHAALRHAQMWLAAGLVRDVLVLAADHAGPFVVNGFASLKCLATDRVTPFAPGRQGIQLGEAAAAILLTTEPPLRRMNLRLSPVALLTEGHALTRSRDDGETLRAVCDATLRGFAAPDIILAHGTGTDANDAMEDRVYRHLPFVAPVTCTKWSVGHALGASGAVDFIAAAEMLKQETVFALGNTSEIDPAFGAPYLTQGKSRRVTGLRRVLFNSVGFGGMHAAALLEKV